jgi:lysozyme
MSADRADLDIDLVDLLRLHEGVRLTPYRDTVGKLTFGVGRNLDDVGLSASEVAALGQGSTPLKGEDAARVIRRARLVGVDLNVFADLLLSNDIGRTARDLGRLVPWWEEVEPDARRAVLLDMAFNMGAAGLARFKTTLQNVRSGMFHAAADSMLRSKWAAQVKGRARRLARIMRTGVLDLDPA